MKPGWWLVLVAFVVIVVGLEWFGARFDAEASSINEEYEP